MIADRRRREIVRRSGHDHEPSVREAGRELARTLQREHGIQLSREHERGAAHPPDERPVVVPQPRLELGEHERRIVGHPHDPGAEQPPERSIEDPLTPASGSDRQHQRVDRTPLAGTGGGHDPLTEVAGDRADGRSRDGEHEPAHQIGARGGNFQRDDPAGGGPDQVDRRPKPFDCGDDVVGHLAERRADRILAAPDAVDRVAIEQRLPAGQRHRPGLAGRVTLIERQPGKASRASAARRRSGSQAGHDRRTGPRLRLPAASA